jgi:hypothetical protein
MPIAYSSPQAALKDAARQLRLPPPVGPFLRFRCPVHQGVSANSASAWIGRDGRLRARCFHPTANCRESDILAALGCAGEFAKPEQTDAEITAEIAAAEQAEQKIGFALRVWNAAVPAQPGFLAHYYLTEIRGIAAPPEVLAALRETGGLRHRASQTTWPALVAEVVDANSEFTAVHRIWLDGGSGDKAPIIPVKATLGPQSHGAVRLYAHPTSKALLVGEGIENALAAGVLDGWQRSVWSTLTTGGMPGLAVPRRFRDVVIAADHDSNQAGERAANVLARRLRAKGVHVRVIKPPEPDTDWNDFLVSKHRGKA